MRCSAETAIKNLEVFLIHVVLRSGAEISILVLASFPLKQTFAAYDRCLTNFVFHELELLRS